MTYILKDLNQEEDASFQAWVAAQQLPKSKVVVSDEAEDDDAGGYIPPTKEEILDGIWEGLHQIKLHQQGKLHLKTLDEVLDELQPRAVAVL